MSVKQDRKRAQERLKQVAWSGLVALTLWWFNTIGPIDQLIWVLQARVAGFEASGDVVFVVADDDLADPDFPHRREELAQAIDNLKRAGAAQVFIDTPFERPSLEESDDALNSAMRSFGSGAYFVRNLVSGIDGDLAFSPLTDEVAAGVGQVGGHRLVTLFGVVWTSPYAIEHGGRRLPSVAAAIARRASGRGQQTFPINYGFDLTSIPKQSLGPIAREHLSDEVARGLRGKSIVIGQWNSSSTINIPGGVQLPEAMAHVYAAETLKAGYTLNVAGWAPLLAAFALLCLAAATSSRRIHAKLVTLLAIALPAAIGLAAFLGVRISVGAAMALLTCYLAFRLRSRWKKELLLADQDTGLPTFVALEGDQLVARLQPALIVAKIHRFEEVRQSLSPDLHPEYVLRIIARLNAASPDTKIYLGPGHLIAWCIEERDRSVMKDHLEGLRALFASPLQVGGKQVDVGITFGVDISPSCDVARRLANSVSAAERTNETYEPILIAETKSEEEMIWNISLQARIDAALAHNEIFLVYQPKIDIETGALIGVEALVRWRDPVRGMIPPDSFISQCETAGRMTQLTRYVLQEACRSGIVLAENGLAISMAVNISATLLHDPAIVTMIREVLTGTGFAPDRLTLEVTETYRISDMGVAATILEDLAALGPTISMDDFGVGAASFEALLRLPFVELKVDRVFVDKISQSAKALGMVRSILQLGRDLRMVVVAEGVEDAATLNLLREAGCSVAQGFGICRPVPLDQIVQFSDSSREPTVRLSI